MYEHILIPLDGSARAEAALDQGIELAKRFGGQLTLLRAVALVPEGLTGKEQIDHIRAEQMRSAQAYLDDLAKRASAAGVQVNTAALPGDAARTILNFAREKAAGAIVINSHGMGGLAGHVFGSVADKVVRGATCPVLVLHERPTAEELRDQEEREEAEFDAVMGIALSPGKRANR